MKLRFKPYQHGDKVKLAGEEAVYFIKGTRQSPNYYSLTDPHRPGLEVIFVPEDRLTLV